MILNAVLNPLAAVCPWLLVHVLVVLKPSTYFWPLPCPFLLKELEERQYLLNVLPERALKIVGFHFQQIHKSCVFVLQTNRNLKRRAIQVKLVPHLFNDLHMMWWHRWIQWIWHEPIPTTQSCLTLLQGWNLQINNANVTWSDLGQKQSGFACHHVWEPNDRYKLSLCKQRWDYACS